MHNNLYHMNLQQFIEDTDRAWEEEYGYIPDERLKSFLRSRLRALLEEVVGECEERKREIKKGVDELGRPIQPTEAFEIRADIEWNRALSSLASHLQEKIKKMV